MTRIRELFQLAMAVICLTVLVLATRATRANSQDASGIWSAPQRIMATEGSVGTGNMATVVDHHGHLHLFYVHWPNESLGRAIEHRVWTEEEGWSESNDIISGDGPLEPLAAAIDENDIIHLVWPGLELNYASAPAQSAHSANAWRSPVRIGRALEGVGIVVSRTGQVYVAFSDQDKLGTVSLVVSSDGGDTWSDTRLVADAESHSAPRWVQLAMDANGGLHVVWTESRLPLAWPNTGVYYSRSEDGGSTWTQPLQVAGAAHSQIGVSVVGRREIHLVWRSNVGGDGTFHQASIDGGSTWLNRNVLDDGGGQSGLPAFGVDSIGRLHFVIGPGKYASWENGRLSGYDNVSAPLFSSVKSSVERAVFAVTNGNRLHLIIEVDGESLWYFSKLLGIPRTVGTTASGLRQGDETAALHSSTPGPESGLSLNQSPRVNVIQDRLVSMRDPFPVFQFILPSALMLVAVLVGRLVWRRL